MLTGDNRRTALAIAGDLGLDEVKAELLPEGKLVEISALKAQGPTAMVGDGINDAPALATRALGSRWAAARTQRSRPPMQLL